MTGSYSQIRSKKKKNYGYNEFAFILITLLAPHRFNNPTRKTDEATKVLIILVF